MNKNSLDVPLFFQQPYEHGCTAACARMVLAYDGHRVSMRHLVKELRVGKTIGAVLPELGNVFLRRGYDVTIVSSPFSASDLIGTTGEAAQKILLRREYNPRRTYGRAIKVFLENGGRWEVRPIVRADLRRALHAGTPPIVGIDASILWRTRIDHGKHVVVMTGLGGNTCRVNDPYRPYGGNIIYDYERFIHACYCAGSDALFASKK